MLRETTPLKVNFILRQVLEDEDFEMKNSLLTYRSTCGSIKLLLKFIRKYVSYMQAMLIEQLTHPRNQKLNEVIWRIN